MTNASQPAFSHGGPLIIGSSLSGLLVSDALSRAGIEHTLIGGGQPAAVPRLGESMNECAGPELWRLYHADFRDCFHAKNHISLLNGRFATQVHLANPNSTLERAARSMFRGDKVRFPFPRNVLIHVDRIEFDRRLYHRVRSRSACRFVEQQVTRLEYDRASDRIIGVIMADGTRIERPSYVFDATGARSLVAAAVGVEKQEISSLQRVAWTHFRHRGSVETPRWWWTLGTNLLRLEQAFDGVDGIAWLIPLGNTLSLGISVDAEDNTTATDKNRLIESLVAAYARRGIDLRASWPERGKVQELTHRYFIRDRAFGANWLLVGGAFAQIWFPSSAGVWTSTAAAGLAPRLIDEPARLGVYYESIIRRLVDFHEHIEQMVHTPPFETQQDVYFFWSRWLAMLPRRISGYLRIVNRRTRRPAVRDRMLEGLSALFLRAPRLQLLYWGLPLIRSTDQPRRLAQAESFDGYFRPLRFRATNYLRGLRYVFRRLVPPHRRKRPHGRGTASEPAQAEMR